MAECVASSVASHLQTLKDRLPRTESFDHFIGSHLCVSLNNDVFLIAFLEVPFSDETVVFETLRPLKMGFKSNLFLKHLLK